MFEHRFREYFASNAEALAPVSCAFVPCPMVMAMPAQQLLRVQEIYRLAAERTQEQHQPRRAWQPEFSVN